MKSSARSESPKSRDWVHDKTLQDVHQMPSPTLIQEQHLTSVKTASTAETGDSHTITPSLRGVRSHLGLRPQAPIVEEDDAAERQKLLWPRIRLILKEPFEEFCGVVIMIMFGNGSVAQVLLSSGQIAAPGGNGFGAYQSISWG